MSKTVRNIGIAAVAAASLSLASCGKPDKPPAAEPGYKVYVTNERSGDLSVIDGATRQVTATYPLGKRPRGIRLGPDGQTLYIALTGSPIAGPGVDESKLPPPDTAADGIAVFDIPSGKVRRIVKGVSNPEQLAVSNAGRLYAADEDAGKLIVMDIVSGAPVGAVPVGAEPEGVALTPDEKQVWVTSEGNSAVVAIDTATLKVLATIPVGERPRNVVFSADGSRAYVVGEADRVVRSIDVAGLKVLNSVTLADDTLRPMGMAVSPDGKTLYISAGRGGQVLALDAETLASKGVAATAGRPWGIALSPDGKLLYSAGGSSDDVAVTDTATMKVLAKIKAGLGPWTVVVVPSAP